MNEWNANNNKQHFPNDIWNEYVVVDCFIAPITLKVFEKVLKYNIALGKGGNFDRSLQVFESSFELIKILEE